MKPKTYVSIILDQSGSMSATKNNAVQGYNEQVQQMKLNSKDQDIYCSLVTFNGEIYEHLWCEEATKLNETSSDDYDTNGSTAMRDAIGYTVNKLMKTTDTKDENNAYLVVVISDGEENSSSHFSAATLRELIDSVQKTKRWTFSYMGCDGQYLKKISKETNIPLENMAVWSNQSAKLATRGMQYSNMCIDKYYKSRAGGQSCSANLYNDKIGLADFTEESMPISANLLLVADKPDLNTMQMNIANAFCNKTPVNWVQ